MLVTGIQAAGKSTVGRILAERFERGAFVEGDLMWKLIVSGRVDMTPDLDPEAIRQPQLRCRNGAMLVDSLVLARFTAVHADIVLAEDLRAIQNWCAPGRFGFVVLTPDADTVVRREQERGSRTYRD